jgi:large subunit ribosomal protein L25
MAEIKVRGWQRTPGGKGAAKRVRAKGRIPAVVYGKGMASIPIELDGADVYALTHGVHAGSLESVIVSVEIQDGGKTDTRPTLITEIQQDPIKGGVLHMDFHQVSLTEKIHARIPVIAVGDCPGVAAGGILEHALRELDVSCLAQDLPEEVRIDISGLGVGGTIHVRDIDLGDKIAILNDPDLSVASVTMPRITAEAAEAEVEEAVKEPELIGEKEEEAEGKEAPGEKKGSQ